MTTREELEASMDRVSDMVRIKMAEIDRLRAENAALREAGEELVRTRNTYVADFGENAVARWRKVAGDQGRTER